MAEDKQSPSEENAKLALSLARLWNDITILILFVMCGWATCYTDIAPLWQEEMAPAVDWSCLVASIMTATAVVFELSALLIEYSPADLPVCVNTNDSKVMLFVYTCLSVSYFKMAVSGNQWVHTDPLAFGGPRPVYTLRYLEWSIAMPLLISLSGDTEEEEEGLESWNDQSTGEVTLSGDSANFVRDQVTMLANLPLVVGQKLLTAPLAASGRCTAVYIWSSWLAVVVTDEFSRWLLLSASFAAYGVATIQQVAFWYFSVRRCKSKNQENQAQDFTILVLTEALLATHYGVIYLLAVFGCISWQYEQLAYTYSDIFAKLFHSIYLVSSRRRRNLLLLEQLRAGSQLAASDLQRMISFANVPIFCVNKELRIEEWNQKIEQLTGVSKADALNRFLPEFYSKQSTNWWNDAGRLLQDTLAGQNSGVVEMQFTSSGRSAAMVAVSATCQRTAKGDIKGAVCIGQDVTELTTEKMRAENLAERLESLIQSANAPIFELDLELNVVRWNSWLKERCGMSLAELQGKPITTVLIQPSKKVIKDAVAGALSPEGNAMELFEIGLVDDMENLQATLLVTVTPTLASSGQTVGTICIGQDITKLKDLEARKASIMAMLSHELKSPLHGITGLSSSLLDDTEVPLSVKKPLSMMQNCAKRLLDMVSNIMDASVLVHDRKMRMSKDKVQLQTIVEEVITLCQQASGEVGSHSLSPGVKLLNNLTQPMPIIEADAYRVTQVIYNLVTNAIKFTHEGSISVSGSYDDSKRQVMVDVIDTGIGISPQNIERVFQPFDQEDSSESRRYGGLGLGLAISREIAAKHGGELTVKSQQGKGSTFRITLPYQMVEPGDPSDTGFDWEAPSTTLADRAFTGTSGEELVADKADTEDSSRKPFSTRFEPIRRHVSRSAMSAEQVLAKLQFQGSYIDRLPPRDADPVILSVDDDSIHQQLVSSMFRNGSYQVVQALDVPEAVDYLQKHRLPSLILLDVMMPDITGVELLKALRQTYPSQILPIVMVSAKGTKDTIAGCLETGANDYVQKPFGKKELMERIRFQLEISRKERDLCRSQSLMRLQGHESDEPSPTSPSPPPMSRSKVPSAPYAGLEPSAEAASAKWLQLAAEEMKSLREERDQALTEVKDLRRRVNELQEDSQKSCAQTEEHQRQVKDFIQRQKVLVAHQHQLSTFMEQLDRFQKVQRQLVASKTSEDAKYFSAPVSFSGHIPTSQGPVGESLRELQLAEQTLHSSLSRMTEIASSMTGDVKEELLCLIATPRKDMGNLLMNMGRKCYLLLDAQSKLQDQAIQLQRVMLPSLVGSSTLHHSLSAM